MYMTKNEASSILNVPEDASKEEIKQIYAKVALTTHPDQKSSTSETTKIFETVSMAYKRMQQPANNDWVELSSLMEQFSTVFRFRMKTENGYVYFMYNPFTGLPDSDSEDGFDDDDDIRSNENGFNNLLFNYPPRKTKSIHSLVNHKKIVELDREKFEEMQANANKNAEELINEEDKAKDKAKKKKEKRLRQKEKKKKNLQKNSSNEIPNLSNGNTKHNNYAGSESSSSHNSDSKQINKSSNSFRRKVNISGEIVSGVDSHQNSEVSWKQHNAHKNGYRSDGSEFSDHDEDWDEDSAFVANAFKNLGISKTKTTKQAPPIKNDTSDQKAPTVQQDKTRDVIALSRQLAMQGNQLAGNQKYEEAVQLFTKAITLFNNDCRYYGNRSYCFDRMEMYERALHDANTAITLSSLWAKGYFRKGRALAGLERYVEAEHAYQEVLKLDPKCFDAEHELKCVRLTHLMDMGFSKQACESALRKGKTIALALEELLPGNPDVVNLMGGNISDEEEFIEAKVKRKPPTSSSPSPSLQSDTSASNDTFTEVDYNSLWIGNMTPEVSEQDLIDYFQHFGQMTGVTAMYERRCAFVNFASTEASKAALLKSDTVTINGAALVIRYPDRAYQQAPSRISYKSKRECFYWRNRGCHFGSACRYLHVEANKGIDLQLVERTPYRSTLQY